VDVRLVRRGAHGDRVDAMIAAEHRPIALLLARLYFAESDAIYNDPASSPSALAESTRLFEAGNEWADRVLDGLTADERVEAWATR